MAGFRESSVVAIHVGRVGVDLVFGGGVIRHFIIVVQRGGGGANGNGGIHRGCHIGKGEILAGDLGLLDEGRGENRGGAGENEAGRKTRYAGFVQSLTNTMVSAVVEKCSFRSARGLSKEGRNTLRALTADGKQRETQVPGQFLPVVGQALRWGKSGVSTPCRPPASPPDHPPRPRIADCTLYIGLLSAKKTTMRASPTQQNFHFSVGYLGLAERCVLPLALSAICI